MIEERKYIHMGKATILEAQNSQTVYEEGKSNNGILGHLKGIFADYKNGTRNSDRLYTEELYGSGPQPERYLFLSEYQHQLFQHDLQGNDRRDIYGGSDPDKDGESQGTSGEYHDEKL